MIPPSRLVRAFLHRHPLESSVPLREAPAIRAVLRPCCGESAIYRRLIGGLEIIGSRTLLKERAHILRTRTTSWADRPEPDFSHLVLGYPPRRGGLAHIVFPLRIQAQVFHPFLQRFDSVKQPHVS